MGSAISTADTSPPFQTGTPTFIDFSPRLSVCRIPPQDAATRHEESPNQRSNSQAKGKGDSRQKYTRQTSPKTSRPYDTSAICHYSAIHFIMALTSSSFSSGVWVALGRNVRSTLRSWKHRESEFLLHGQILFQGGSFAESPNKPA